MVEGAGGSISRLESVRCGSGGTPTAIKDFDNFNRPDGGRDRQTTEKTLDPGVNHHRHLRSDVGRRGDIVAAPERLLDENEPF